MGVSSLSIQCCGEEFCVYVSVLSCSIKKVSSIHPDAVLFFTELLHNIGLVLHLWCNVVIAIIEEWILN